MSGDRLEREVGTAVQPGRPILELHAAGDGLVVVRALARVIVRRELIFANVITEQSNCDAARAAG